MRTYEQPRAANAELNAEFSTALRVLRASGHAVFTKAEIVQNAAHNGKGIARDLDRLQAEAQDLLKQIDALREYS